MFMGRPILLLLSARKKIGAAESIFFLPKGGDSWYIGYVRRNRRQLRFPRPQKSKSETDEVTHWTFRFFWPCRISGTVPAGTILSSFLRVFYVVFLFPLCAKLFEGRARATAHTA